MIDKTALLAKLDRIEKLARGGVLNRFLHHPVRYLTAILYWRLIYPIKKKGRFASGKTFFGKNMQVVLPAATEIYLFGAKTHDSEIRLARLLIFQLNAGDVFCDVGAHFGYFSLLAAHLTGEEGKVVAMEASKNTYGVFHKNVLNEKNVEGENKAAAESNQIFTFYEYPVLYSEYNSLTKPNLNSKWLQGNRPDLIKIQGQKLEDFFEEKEVCPTIIKIDVEGAELQVLKGMAVYLRDNNPIIVMEYITDKYQNDAHEKAIVFLNSLGFETFIIDSQGKLIPEKEIIVSLKKRNLDSDNIVFLKK